MLMLALVAGATACLPHPDMTGSAGAGAAGTGGAGGYSQVKVGTGGQPSGSGGGLATSGFSGSNGSGGMGAAGRGAQSGGGSGGTSGGSGGSGGPGGMGATMVASTGGVPPPTRGPTPAQNGMKFPFPQNRESSRCIYPQLYRNEDVQAAYQQWKADTVTSDGGAKVGANQYRRVKRPAEPGLEMGSTVSEGIGYGMLIAVYMGDQALFDDLWKYEQGWLDGNGLMDWYINAAGTTRLGTGAATDADEDMAFALVMADRQWGGMGAQSKTYLQLAKDQIGKIWSNEVFDYKYLKPGDTWGDSSSINISYFAPYYYRVFAKLDTANTTNWNNLLQTSYDTLTKALNASNGNQDNGLVPAWCRSDGSPNGGVFSGAPTNYQYDSCRTPFRIGMDYCLFGETRAKDYVTKTSNFFSGIGVPNIVDGYNLDGTPKAEFQKDAMSQIQSAAFIGPAGVGAMAMSGAPFQTFVNQAYAAVATGKLLVGGVYYDSSWTVISMLMMTANFLDYTTY